MCYVSEIVIGIITVNFSRFFLFSFILNLKFVLTSSILALRGRSKGTLIKPLDKNVFAAFFLVCVMSSFHAQDKLIFYTSILYPVQAFTFLKKRLFFFLHFTPVLRNKFLKWRYFVGGVSFLGKTLGDNKFAFTF